MTARNFQSGNDDDDTPSASRLFRTQSEFAEAICRGERRALEELFVVYAPLLRDQARKFGVRPELRRELVTTVLDDVVVHLQGAASPPRVLGKYVVAALRNRARKWKRDELRRQQRLDAVGHDRVMEDHHSHYALKAANPGRDEDATLRSAVAQLAAHSVQELTAIELNICVGMARRIPVRELAEQLGISYGAARVRVFRLRERLWKIMHQHIAALDVTQRREVERFVRRAGRNTPLWHTSKDDSHE